LIEKINDNAYKLELPADFRTVNPTFNIADLKPYFGEEDEIASRMTSIQEGGHDEDIPSIYRPAVPTTIQIQGPIARAHAKQLNYQVILVLGTFPHIHENVMLPKSDLFLLLGMMDLAWTRGKSIGAWSCMEMAASMCGLKGTLQV
jgi:hypothetical protein